MADFAQGLDPAKFVFAETILSFVTCAFAAPPYNLPLFLFGTYAQESQEAVESLKTFTFLLAGSFVYDIVWMARHEQNWFIRLVTIIVLILKVPTFFTFGMALRQRGAQFSALSFRGNDLGGATVWTMPGGFTSAGREGYQNVDDPADGHVPKGNSVPGAPAPAPNQTSTPGTYQIV